MPPDPAADAPLHLKVTDGRVVSRLNGESTVVKLEPEWTRGAYALRSNTAPPHFVSVPLHRHRDMEEAALRAVHERYGLEILGPPPDWEAPTA